MNKIKIAQIGIGHDHATEIFQSLVKQTYIFEVVGYYLPAGEAEGYAEKLQSLEGYKKLTLDEIMANPEIVAVTIETEEKNLTKYALMAAEHGKHVHMDKPGGMDEAEFEKLIDTVKAKKLVFHTGYMYRYNPEVKKLMSKEGREQLGEILSIEAHMSGVFPPTPEKRQWLSQFPGGDMFYLGCHLVDIILNMQGMPEKITTFIKSTKMEGVTSQDFGMAVFEYPTGTSFIKVNAREVLGFDRRQIVVSGAKKTVELKPTEFYIEEDMFTKITEYTDKDSETRVTPPFDRYDDMMASFAAMVRGERENPWSYDYELMLYRCIMEVCGVKRNS